MNTESSKYDQAKYNKVPLMKKIKPYLIMAPGFLLTVGILYPFISAIFYSLTDFSFRSATYDFIGFENWAKMFTNSDFWNALWVTAQYALATTVTQMLLGLGVAMLLNKDTWFTKILKLLLIFPLMIAPVIATLIWQLMINPSVGILEHVLNFFGIFNFAWASSPATALFTVALIDTWVYAPFVILLALAGLNSLPKSPFESAKIDGGSAWFTFKTLTLPLLKPFLYIALIFRLMDSLKMFDIIFALTKGGPGNTLMNLSLVGYNKGFAFLNLGEGLPYVIFLWLVVFIISRKLVTNFLLSQKTASGN